MEKRHRRERMVPRMSVWCVHPPLHALPAPIKTGLLACLPAADQRKNHAPRDRDRLHLFLGYFIPHGVDTIDDPMTTRTRVVMVLACSRLMALKFLIIREVGALLDLIFRPRH